PPLRSVPLSSPQPPPPPPTPPLSLHDALPIYARRPRADAPSARRNAHDSSRAIASGRPPSRAIAPSGRHRPTARGASLVTWMTRDRKSTRLNSSHDQISYAVFCLKKKTTSQPS